MTAVALAPMLAMLRSISVCAMAVAKQASISKFWISITATSTSIKKRSGDINSAPKTICQNITSGAAYICTKHLLQMFRRDTISAEVVPSSNPCTTPLPKENSSIINIIPAKATNANSTSFLHTFLSSNIGSKNVVIIGAVNTASIPIATVETCIAVKNVVQCITIMTPRPMRINMCFALFSRSGVLVNTKYAAINGAVSDALPNTIITAGQGMSFAKSPEMLIMRIAKFSPMSALRFWESIESQV